MTRWPPSSETSRAKTRIPIRRANGRPVRAAGVDEPRADDEVGLAALERGEQRPELARIVLPVAVEADRGVVSLGQSVT